MKNDAEEHFIYLFISLKKEKTIIRAGLKHLSLKAGILASTHTVQKFRVRFIYLFIY